MFSTRVTSVVRSFHASVCRLPAVLPGAIVCLASVACTAAAGGAEREMPTRKALAVSVDPRIELMGVVQLLTEGYPVKTQLDFGYRERVENHFSPYAGHPVFSTFAELYPRGFSFDAPIALMLHLSPPPELSVVHAPPPALVARAGGAETMNRFLEELRDFADASDFGAFFAAQASLYDEFVARPIAFAAAEPLVEQLEAYYGMEQEGYAMILSPLTAGGFGPSVEVAQGRFLIYSVASPSGLEEGGPVFVSEKGLRNLVWHEFAHSFVNPLTQRHWEKLEGASGLLEPIVEGLPQWYRQWKPALDEHLVRAVTVRLTAIHQGPEAAEATLAQQVEWGFVYVPELVKALERFDGERDRYPTFEAFFPELVHAVEALQAPES